MSAPTPLVVGRNVAPAIRGGYPASLDALLSFLYTRSPWVSADQKSPDLTAVDGFGLTSEEEGNS